MEDRGALVDEAINTLQEKYSVSALVREFLLLCAEHGPENVYAVHRDQQGVGTTDAHAISETDFQAAFNSLNLDEDF